MLNLCFCVIMRFCRMTCHIKNDPAKITPPARHTNHTRFADDFEISKVLSYVTLKTSRERVTAITPPISEKIKSRAVCFNGISPLNELAKRPVEIIANPFEMIPIVMKIVGNV
ncbi:MAG: hypothetical protein DRP02_10545 [Candidatus Gerdarchaeota archaeon]|nr:MAG: hypothetical protein DRP02_10545 [Candidatus Gerdarchaeota archaeon]